MKIILKENIENLGKKGDIVNVAAGYGRNYLVPKKMALEITPTNTKMIEIEQRSLKKGLEKEMKTYQTLIEQLNEVALTFERRAGDKDSIFGSVSTADIKDALSNLNFDIEKKKILLPDPIKKLGNYKVPIKIFHDQTAEISLEVNREGTPDQEATPPPDPKKEEVATPEVPEASLPKAKKEEAATEAPVEENGSTEEKK
jgi:large subunit ribosomal protein L9